ncbi:MAG: glycosyltransferase [Candidatus Diapherotrites archaeon]
MLPKKVLLVSDFAWPVKAGTERLVYGAASWMAANGIQADILTPNWNNLPEVQTQEGVNIYAFNTHPIDKSDAMRRIADYVKAGEKLGKYDVYYGVYTIPPMTAAIQLAKKLRAKSVINIFGRDQLEKGNFSNPLKKWWILHTLKQANQLTCYTWAVKKYFEEGYFKGKQFEVLQGWSEEKFKPLKVGKPKKKIVLFVGRIDESKGIFVLLRAFARIKDKVNAELVCIGPPYQKERFEQIVKELELQDCVKLLGFVSDEELNEWYCKCEFIAVPPLHGDAYGLSLMEALMLGKPTICTDWIGSPDGVEDDALTVERGNIEQLAEMMEKLLNDSNYYKHAVEISKKRAQLFHKKEVMQKYLDVFERVLER